MIADVARTGNLIKEAVFGEIVLSETPASLPRSQDIDQRNTPSSIGPKVICFGRSVLATGPGMSGHQLTDRRCLQK